MTRRLGVTIRAPGIATVISTGHGEQLFVTGRCRRRRHGHRWHCERCGEVIPSGTLAYRTVNQSVVNRSWRLCVPCVEGRR